MYSDRTEFIEVQNQRKPLYVAHNEFDNIIFYSVICTKIALLISAPVLINVKVDRFIPHLKTLCTHNIGKNRFQLLSTINPRYPDLYKNLYCAASILYVGGVLSFLKLLPTYTTRTYGVWGYGHDLPHFYFEKSLKVQQLPKF